MYQALGLTADDWCSTINAYAGQCKGYENLPAKICIPLTADALAQVKRLQRDTNRVRAFGSRKALLAVDGRIGEKTRAAVEYELKQGEKRIPGVNLGPFNYCDNIMSNLDNVSAAMARLAVGTPQVTDPQPRTPPSVPLPDGSVRHPPVSAMKAGLSPVALAVFAIGGYLIYKYATK